MIRATVDTNTLASGAVATGGPIAILIEVWFQGDLEVVISSHIVTEPERTLRKPYFMGRLTAEMREEFLNLVRETATIIPITTPIPTAVTSRADNLVLATAESAGVAYVVTGDAELLRLGAYGSITICSARQFLGRLNLEDSKPQ